MGGEDQKEYMDEEEEEFKTPQHVEKKRKKGKEIANQDDENTITVRIKQIHERPDRISPVVAYFSTGYDPCAVDPKTPKVMVYKHKDESKKRLQVVVSPPNSKVEFVGTNYTGEQAARQTTMYSLAFLNKKKKTLSIVPIAYNKIIRLEPRIIDTDDSGASVSAVTAEQEQPSERERRNKTNSLYGTKKAVNRDKKKQALNMGDDLDTQKLLDGKLNEVDANTSALESTSSTVARNIPPYDASATTPTEAYPLEKIIDKGEWKFLEDIYWLLQQDTGAAPTDSYPVFVRNRLYKLRDIKDHAEKQMVSGALTLLTHLLKFKDRNSMNGYESAKDHKIPEIISRKCLSLFKDPESDRIPVDKANLLISYVLVLSLHVDHFKTDPTDIAKDLRMSTVVLRSHFENLGCKLSHEKSTSTLVATLPTPLSFPVIRRKRKTNKR